MYTLIEEIKTPHIKTQQTLGSVPQLVGASPYKPKGCGFNSPTGHIPSLWVKVHAGSNR